ncbi:calcium-binding protein [Egbenema bharatensis]|uniref:calcium-binding protein n=1 Tax=Egbenema bharatensis TaxID=3463334 RepID=UPI003A8C243A
MAIINGNEANNNLVGTPADDQINGLGGHDTLIGGAGDDTLAGGDGYDVLKPYGGVYQPNPANVISEFDVLIGGKDPDLFDLTDRSGNPAYLNDDRLDDPTPKGFALIRDFNSILTSTEGDKIKLSGAPAHYRIIPVFWGQKFGNEDTANTADLALVYIGPEQDKQDVVAVLQDAPRSFIDNEGLLRLESIFVFDPNYQHPAPPSPPPNPNVISAVSYTLGANERNLTLIGTDNVNGTGNEFDNVIIGNSGNNLLQGLGGNDTLVGGAGDDTLDGGTGSNLMQGGLGDDTYIVNSATDLVVENPNEGTDTVLAALSYTLTENVENLRLTGNGNINGTGNELNNVIIGNAGVNTLDGGAGNDTLIGGRGRDRMVGGSGADRFVFTGPRDGVKRIADFNRREGDKLVFLNQAFEGSEGFEGLRSGRIRRNQFHVGKRAESDRHRFIYNENRGILFYDADGAGGQRQVRIATFANQPTLRASDIIVAASPF